MNIPNDDLIRRQDAIMCLLQNVPSAEPWIPIECGKPDEGEDVIISVCDDHGDTPWYYTTQAFRLYEVYISDNDVVCGTVEAWRPMPEPYKRKK